MRLHGHAIHAWQIPRCIIYDWHTFLYLILDHTKVILIIIKVIHDWIILICHEQFLLALSFHLSGLFTLFAAL